MLLFFDPIIFVIILDSHVFLGKTFCYHFVLSFTYVIILLTILCHLFLDVITFALIFAIISECCNFCCHPHFVLVLETEYFASAPKLYIYSSGLVNLIFCKFFYSFVSSEYWTIHMHVVPFVTHSSLSSANISQRHANYFPKFRAKSHDEFI
jgi:hypothetical protein